MTCKLQLVPVFGAVCVLPSGSSSLCSLAIEAQLVYVRHNQWKDISELVIAERIRCWGLLELPIRGAAFGACCVQYVCSLTIYLTLHTWTERKVCASTCFSFPGNVSLPLVPSLPLLYIISYCNSTKMCHIRWMLSSSEVMLQRDSVQKCDFESITDSQLWWKKYNYTGYVQSVVGPNCQTLAFECSCIKFILAFL